MKFPSLLFRVLFTAAMGWQVNASFAQPFQWQVRDDENGNYRFSLRADSIQALTYDLFIAHLQNESILFRQTPLQPVHRLPITRFLALNNRFFALMCPSGWQLRDCRFPEKIGNMHFDQVEVWRGQVLGKRNKNYHFIPENGEEVEADSVHIYPDKIHFFRKDGILWLDSLFQTKFFRTSSTSRRFNQPFFTYLRSDSSWIPLSGNGLVMKDLPSSFWWNDTCLLDTTSKDVFIQTPSKIRNRLGDSIQILSKEVLTFFTGKKSCLLFSGGQKISIPPVRERRVVNDSLCAMRLPKSWVIISKKGNRYPMKQALSQIGELSENLMLVRSGRRWGCTDLSGIIRISCRYDSLLPVSMGLMAARLGNQWGFLDQDERIAIQPNYEMVQPFRDSVSLVQREKKWGLLKRNGIMLLPCEFDAMLPFKNGKWKLKKGLWTGIGLPDGNFLLKPRYSDIIETSSGLLQVERDGKKGLFNQTGKALLPLEYSQIIPDSSHGILLTR